MIDHPLTQQQDRTIDEVREIIAEGIRISKKTIESIESQLPQLESLKARAAQNSFISDRDREKLNNFDDRAHRILRKEKVVFSTLQRLREHAELVNQNIEDRGDKNAAFGDIVYLVASTITLSLDS